MPSDDVMPGDDEEDGLFPSPSSSLSPPSILSRLSWLFGVLLRAFLALSLLSLTLWLCVLVVQSSWRGGGTTTTRVFAKRDEVAEAFAFCAIDGTTGGSGSTRGTGPTTTTTTGFGAAETGEFVKNWCWDVDPLTDSVARAGVLLDAKAFARLFLVDARLDSKGKAQGVQDEVGGVPALETDFNLFKLEPSPDGLFFDLKRYGTSTLRTREMEMVPLIEDALGHGVMTALRVIKYGNEQVWLDCTELVQKLFFVVAVPDLAAVMMTTTRKQTTEGNDPALNFPLSPIKLLLRLIKAAVYPKNSLIKMEIVNPEFLSISITFSLTLLEKTPRRAREAHDSVGYFTSGFRLIGSSPANVVDQIRHVFPDDTVVKIINRRSSFDFYIDPSVPLKWRNSVKRGVEKWNEVFEEIPGETRRMRAVLPGDADFPLDYDAGDVRYSSISWSISLHQVFALGPSTVDPRSGEIINSDIVLSHGWLRSWFEDVEEAEMGWWSNPQQPGEDGKRHRLLKTSKRPRCSLRGMFVPPVHSRRRVLLSDESVEPNTPFFRFIDAGIQNVVMHECGHALGLRHNFKGSLAVPLDKLDDVEYLRQHGLTNSVMDYLPVNDAAVEEEFAFPHKIGHYDKVAVRYGYQSTFAAAILSMTLTDGTIVESAQDEKLDSIARLAGAFSTDEDNYSGETGSDPESSIFDLSADPLGYAVQRLNRAEKARALVSTHHPAHHVDRIQKTITWDVIMAALGAAKYLGGRIIQSRGLRLHGIEIINPLEETQTKALGVVLDVLFATNRGFFPVATWYTSKGQCSNDNPQQYCYGVDEVDYQAHVDRAKSYLLKRVFSYERMDRIERFSSEATTLHKVLTSVERALFGAENFPDSNLWYLQSIFLRHVVDLISTAEYQTRVLAGSGVQNLKSASEIVGRPNRKVLAALKSSTIRIGDALRALGAPGNVSKLVGDSAAQASLCYGELERAMAAALG